MIPGYYLIPQPPSPGGRRGLKCNSPYLVPLSPGRELVPAVRSGGILGVRLHNSAAGR